MPRAEIPAGKLKSWTICSACSSVVEIADEDACDCHFTGETPQRIVVVGLEQLKEEVLSDETRKLAGRAAYEDFEPDGDWDSLGEALQKTWEGNTAAGLHALLSSIPIEGEER